MAEEQRDEDREEAPFDENPPVDPSTAQVGNSNARFFMPKDDDEEEGDEGGDVSGGEGPGEVEDAPRS
jgi:hypothetical protein